MYKQSPKSPMLKALKGNQGKLPQQLQNAIKAAPESPAKQTKKQEYIIAENKKADKKLAKKNDVKDSYKAREAVKSGSYANYDDAKKDAAKSRMARYGFPESVKSASPAKQTTAGEFAHKKSIKDKEMGKSTKAVDKVKAAYDAMTTDKTYADAKKGYRKAAKKAYDAKSPAKVKDPVTGSKVKGYAKSDLKVDKVRDKQERKATKAEKLSTAKSDGKVTRLERKGIKDSQAKLKNEQVAKRNNKFQDQKVADKTHKERTKLRAKSKKLSDAVAVGYDKSRANDKMNKATNRANKKVSKAKVKAEKRSF
jgi:hypothetical protein